MNAKRLRSIALLLGTFFVSMIVSAHPMDLGILKIESPYPGNERIAVDLKLHELAVAKFAGDSPKAKDLFAATLGQEKPSLNGIECEFLAPKLTAEEPSFIHLQTYLVCRNSRSFQLTWKLPFLAKMPADFQLMVQADWNGKSVISTLNRDQNLLQLGDSSRTFFGFVQMGMAHIGVNSGEWLTDDGHLKIAEGLDHIFFVLALVLAGRGAWGLLKTVSGFTLGHSLTLALTMFQVIHIHSRWIEIGIAASIAFVAARAFFYKGSRAENWIIATLFGAIHGLGFSGALRDLELPTSQILSALVGFNLGVEIGQGVLILIFLSMLWCIRRMNERYDKPARQILSGALFLVGIVWTFQRFVG